MRQSFMTLNLQLLKPAARISHDEAALNGGAFFVGESVLPGTRDKVVVGDPHAQPATGVDAPLHARDDFPVGGAADFVKPARLTLGEPLHKDEQALILVAQDTGDGTLDGQAATNAGVQIVAPARV